MSTLTQKHIWSDGICQMRQNCFEVILVIPLLSCCSQVISVAFNINQLLVKPHFCPSEKFLLQEHVWLTPGGHRKRKCGLAQICQTSTLSYFYLYLCLCLCFYLYLGFARTIVVHSVQKKMWSCADLSKYQTRVMLLLLIVCYIWCARMQYC